MEDVGGGECQCVGRYKEPCQVCQVAWRVPSEGLSQSAAVALTRQRSPAPVSDLSVWLVRDITNLSVRLVRDITNLSVRLVRDITKVKLQNRAFKTD